MIVGRVVPLLLMFLHRSKRRMIILHDISLGVYHDMHQVLLLPLMLVWLMVNGRSSEPELLKYFCKVLLALCLLDIHSCIP